MICFCKCFEVSLISITQDTPTHPEEHHQGSRGLQTLNDCAKIGECLFFRYATKCIIPSKKEYHDTWIFYEDLVNARESMRGSVAAFAFVDDIYSQGALNKRHKIIPGCRPYPFY